MATEDLIHLIDLSLGVQPQGVVNFNYLHDLMHGIVKRLGSLTDVYTEEPRSWNGRYVSGKDVGGRRGKDTVRDRAEDSRKGKDGVAGVVVTDDRGKDGKDGLSRVKDGVSEGSRGKDEGSRGKDGMVEGKDTVAEGKDAGLGGKDEITGDSRGKDGVTEDLRRKDGVTKSHSAAKGKDTIDAEGDQDGCDSRDGSAATSASPKRQLSRSSIRQYTSRPGLYVSAANDVGALERKLLELERRVNTMESLPEMLERMAVDSGATPVSDMWNFTNLHRRLTATEDGLGKVSTIVQSCTIL